MAESDPEQDSWVPLVKAARRLGRHPDGLRAMIRRGRLKGRKGNSGQWLVQVPAGVAESHPDDDSDPAGELAALREELAESRVAAARAQAALDSVLAGHERERDSLNAVIFDLRA